MQKFHFKNARKSIQCFHAYREIQTTLKMSQNPNTRQEDDHVKGCTTNCLFVVFGRLFLPIIIINKDKHITNGMFWKFEASKNGTSSHFQITVPIASSERKIIML